jgi:two-component system sensor kinase FixL
MSSALAHELNQPISAIMSYIDAAQHLLGAPGGQSPPRVQDMLTKAATQSRRAGQIVHHLRNYVLTGETEKSEEDLNNVVQDSLAMALIGSGSRNVAVKLELGSSLPKALIDRVQVQQIIVNLLRNGVEAIVQNTKPSLTIATARHDDGFLKVTVADNGPGIDPEIADRLFHPFVTTKPKGMGIGLSICRSIVDNHGGRIWVEDGPLGGAAFTFTLPAVNEQTDDGAS